MDNQANYNGMDWIEDAEQQMSSLIPIDDDGNTLNSNVLEDISSPEQVCNAVFEAIKIPGSDVLANPDKAIKALRNAIKVIKNPSHAKRKTGAFLTALAVILNACQPGNVLSRTSAGKEAAAKYSSVDDLASASSSEIDTIVGAAEAVSSPVESTEKKPKYIPFSIPMGEIASNGSTWYTNSGKKLIDSIIIAYAKYGMLASFDNIRINISIVPHESIKELCVDPETGTRLNTEYACTVNPRNTLFRLAPIINETYGELRQSALTKKRITELDCIDNSALEFNVFMSDVLPVEQLKELLVHEIKYCLHIYAYVQKAVSMYARGYDWNSLINFTTEMGNTGLASIGTELGKLLDSNETFEPGTVFLSDFDMISAVMRYTELRPFRR